MPGFFVCNVKINIELRNRYQKNCIIENIESSNATIKRNTLNKFMQDKAFFDNEYHTVIVDGYLLNKQELFEHYQVDNVNQLVINMYKQNGEKFFSEFKGSFSGAIYDKQINVWIIYTNQTGDNIIYYGVEGEYFFVGSQVNYVLDAYKNLNIPLTFDEQAAYQMLTFAFMVDDSTYAKQIKRLCAGMYLYVENGKVIVKEYHKFTKHYERFINKSEEEIIEDLDEAFRNAVELEYRKDEEYNCYHLTDMSGGLDSRMNAWVAHINKPRHLQLITYCKANYLDEIISKEISIYWKDELLDKTLDDATYLYDIDEIVMMNGGLSLYSGITGGKRMLQSLNMDLYGLEHTGMVGDVVIGSFCHSKNDINTKLPTGRYSEKLVCKLNNKLEIFHDKFYDHELYLLYTRGFQGAANTIQIRKNFTEVSSPFMHPDFLQLCFDIPQNLRANHYMYKKWIESKYPQAAKFRWEKTRGKITEPRVITYYKKIITRGPNKIMRLLGKDEKITFGMNPLDYFISHNIQLKNYLDEYEKNAYKFLPDTTSESLINDMKFLYMTGNANEKTMVLTILSSLKLYFGDRTQ